MCRHPVLVPRFTFSPGNDDRGVKAARIGQNDLFDFALEEVDAAGWKMIAFTRDLHTDEKLNEGNIMTEYEAKFSALGNPINKYIIQKP